MGRITVDQQQLARLLARAGEQEQPEPYVRAFRRLGETHQGQPVAQILPRLRQAADRARLVFDETDLAEQAEAISQGRDYELRIHLR